MHNREVESVKWKVESGKWKVHVGIADTTIFNFHLSIFNLHFCQGVDEKSLYIVLLLASTTFSRLTYAMKSLQTCNRTSTYMYRTKRTVLIKMSEPSVRKNLFV